MPNGFDNIQQAKQAINDTIEDSGMINGGEGLNYSLWTGNNNHFTRTIDSIALLLPWTRRHENLPDIYWKSLHGISQTGK